MDILLEIGIPGWMVITCQIAIFSLILNLGLHVNKSSRPLRLSLKRCLSESRDLITEDNSEMNLARDCATRYRTAAEKIEGVNAYAIACSEISRVTACRFLKRSWSYPKIDELLHGGSGFLVTLGLIGTFFGLMANMVQLSELVLASEGASQQSSLMQGLAAVFPSMAAAFTTSLVGVLLSSSLWIIGTINGMLTVKDELVELLSGYLEQVVQADCRRYSLVGESMERMEQYLTSYLSNFSKEVGGSIEHAIKNNISSLVSSLNYQVDQISSLVSRIKEDSCRLSDASQIYYDASKVLSESDFADRFGDACALFLKSTDEFNRSAALLANASAESASSCKQLSESITVSSEVTESLGASLIEANSNTTKVLTFGVESIAKLREATGAIEAIQKRGMTWLSMRAKTDQQLMEINSQLNNVITNIASVALQVANTRASDIEEISRSVSAVSDIADQVSEAVMRQDSATKEVVTGLEQMKLLAARIAAFDSLHLLNSSASTGNANA